MINEETQLDSALQLKKYVRDIGCPESADIQHCLENSTVIAKILAEKIRTDTFTGLRKLEFLLAELSEFPSLNGWKRFKSCSTHFTSKQMLTKAFHELENITVFWLVIMHFAHQFLFVPAKKEWAEQGIQWIISYFPFDRNEPSNWHGKDLFHRFGGCVGNSPCYDGVVKSVKALSEYAEKIRRASRSSCEVTTRFRLYFEASGDFPSERRVFIR